MRRKTFDALAAIAGLVLALFLILSGLGFWHLRRTAPESEIFPKVATTVPANAS